MQLDKCDAPYLEMSLVQKDPACDNQILQGIIQISQLKDWDDED